MITNKKTKMNARILQLLNGNKRDAYLWWNSLNTAFGTTPKAMWKGNSSKRLTLIMYILTFTKRCCSQIEVHV